LTANTGIAMTNIIAAMTNATVTDIMMRLISTTSLVEVGAHFSPALLTNAITVASTRYRAHPPNELSLLWLGRC
jgi:hypothetical protein